MNTKRFLCLLLLLVSVLVISSCCGCPIRCANGEPVRDIDVSKDFADYTQGYDTSVALAVSNVANVLGSGQISVNTKNEITNFQQTLDQDSIRLKLKLKSALETLRMTPCSDEALKGVLALQNFIDSQSLAVAKIAKGFAIMQTVAIANATPTISTKVVGTTTPKYDKAVSTLLELYKSPQ